MNGNEHLIADLEILLEDSQNMQFDDMQSDVSNPKTYLVSRLQALIDKTKSGKYD